MKSIRNLARQLLLPVLAALLLSACQAAGTPAATDYPAPSQATALPEVQPTKAADAVEVVSGYPVLPGDENKVTGNFFLDKAEMRPNTANSTLTDIFVSGSLPTPCNEARAYVNPPNESKQLFVKVYSVADKDKVCTQVLQPYEGVVATLSDIPAGQYTVIVNEMILGEITIP